MSPTAEEEEEEEGNEREPLGVETGALAEQ